MNNRIEIALQSIIKSQYNEYDRILDNYSSECKRFFGVSHSLPLWKGRVALYTILKALDIREGDEVLIPGYTCMVVPGAVIQTRATPVYADIDSANYNISVDEIKRKINKNTKALVVQHTYGVPADIVEIKEIADEHGVPIIEDCCHTFGGRHSSGQMLGTFGKAAFFSGQWSKFFSTGLGGLAITNDPELGEKISQLYEGFASVPEFTARMLAFELLIHQLLVFPVTHSLVQGVFKWLGSKNLILHSSQEEEFVGETPSGYALKSIPVQAVLGMYEISRIEENIAWRIKMSERYYKELPVLGFTLPDFKEGELTPMVRLPARVSNKEELLNNCWKHGVEIGSWFVSPLDPVPFKNLHYFGYEMGCCPIAETISREVINLPVHMRTSQRDFNSTIDFLKKYAKPI